MLIFRLENGHMSVYAKCSELFHKGILNDDPSCFLECCDFFKQWSLSKHTSIPPDEECELRLICARSFVHVGKLCNSDVQALTYFRKALHTLQPLSKDGELADLHCNFALRIRDNDAKEAEQHFRKAIAVAQKLEDRLKKERQNNNETEPTVAIESGHNNFEGADCEEETELSSFELQELDAGRVAQYNLALLLAQACASEQEVNAHCMALQFKYRLSSEVLAHRQYIAKTADLPFSLHVDCLAKTEDRKIQAKKKRLKYVQTYEEAIPPQMLRQLQKVFSPSASFWEEHGYYEEPGFFSYYYSLDQAPKSVVELLIQRLRPLVMKSLQVSLCLNGIEIEIEITNAGYRYLRIIQLK